jgi:hypothetical protein
MKYETPELRASTAAVNAIQGQGTSKLIPFDPDSPASDYEMVSAYADWES